MLELLESACSESTGSPQIQAQGTQASAVRNLVSRLYTACILSRFLSRYLRGHSLGFRQAMFEHFYLRGVFAVFPVDLGAKALALGEDWGL